MRISLIILCLVPTIAFSSVNTQKCQVVSLTQNPTDSELESGLNKDKLCSDAIDTLSLKKGYTSNSPLLLQVTSREMYSVNMLYTFTTEEGEMISGKGTEFWYPGDSSFEIE